MKAKRSIIAVALSGLLVVGCASTTVDKTTSSVAQSQNIVGTTTPFASEAVYFVVTDRFVDGDKANNHENQGAITPHGSFL